jgi:FkbM family methyltransferase
MGARVLAFEPDPGNFALLRANVPNAAAYSYAVGDRDENAYLERWRGHSGDHRIHRNGDAPHQDAITPVPVRMIRLEPYVTLWRPRVIKIDAQGWEPQVIAGMGGQTVEALIVEYSPYHIDAAGTSPHTALDAWHERYEVSRLDDDDRSPYEMARGYTNLLLRRRDA